MIRVCICMSNFDSMSVHSCGPNRKIDSFKSLVHSFYRKLVSRVCRVLLDMFVCHNIHQLSIKVVAVKFTIAS